MSGVGKNPETKPASAQTESDLHEAQLDLYTTGITSNRLNFLNYTHLPNDSYSQENIKFERENEKRWDVVKFVNGPGRALIAQSEYKPDDKIWWMGEQTPEEMLKGYELTAQYLNGAKTFALNEISVSRDQAKLTIAVSAMADKVDLSHVQGFENIEKAMTNAKFAAAVKALHFTKDRTQTKEHAAFLDKEAAVLTRIADGGPIDAREEILLSQIASHKPKAHKHK